MELLERLRVADRAGHLPDRLSGGERQRVAAARALVNEPMLMLADEPTGNLDSRATGDILGLFAELRDARQTLLVVTHDARVASTADRLLTMRDGAIVGQTRLDGGPADGERPRRARRSGGRARVTSLAARRSVGGRNLRRRPGQALLLLLTLTIATTMLGLGLGVYGSADAAWDRAWRATDGFHVSLDVYHPPDEPGNHDFVEAMRRRGRTTRIPLAWSRSAGRGRISTARSMSPADERT